MYIKSIITTCTTLPNDDVILTRFRGVPERETPEFILPILWPPNSPDLNPVDYSMCSVGYCKRREGVQNTHHRSRRPPTSHRNEVGQPGSRRDCCSCASVASSSYRLCQGGRRSFRTLLLILTLCFCDNCDLKYEALEPSLPTCSRIEQLQADIPVWFSSGCQLCLCVF